MNLDPLLRPFESLLNRNLTASTPARALLARVQGRRFAVEIDGLPLRLHLTADELGLKLASGDAPADVTVRGTPLGLLGLLREDSQEGLRRSGTTIAGDAELAQNFRSLLRHARPELAEELARFVGEAPAHELTRLAGRMFDFGRRSAETFASNVAEYLQEEGRDAPARLEVEEFMSGVDRLREDLDRAEARLRLLEQRRGTA